MHDKLTQGICDESCMCMRVCAEQDPSPKPETRVLCGPVQQGAKSTFLTILILYSIYIYIYVCDLCPSIILQLPGVVPECKGSIGRQKV